MTTEDNPERGVPLMKPQSFLFPVAVFSAALTVAAQQPVTSPTNLGSDPNGNPLRLALKTGHVSNYDETKVKPYTLPDPLVRADGSPVRDRRAWTSRRAEILRLYETHIYGRAPRRTPKVSWQVLETETGARAGTATLKRVVGRIGDAAAGPAVNLRVVTPAGIRARVPLILLVNFGGGAAQTPSAAGGRGPAASGEPPVAAEILARGWGYATVG